MADTLPPHVMAYERARLAARVKEMEAQREAEIQLQRDAQDRFFVELAKSGVVNVALDAARPAILRRDFLAWKGSPTLYPDFAARFADAMEQSADRLEGELMRRAVDGWDEPVFGSLGAGAGSGEIGTVRRYSDRLLELGLKARRPSLYRDKIAVTGADGTGPAVFTLLIDRPHTPRLQESNDDEGADA